jgi:hypothetical protein
VRYTTVLEGGGNRNKIVGFEGSQAVPALVEVRLVCGICSILIFKEVGVGAMGRNVV